MPHAFYYHQGLEGALPFHPSGGESGHNLDSAVRLYELRNVWGTGLNDIPGTSYTNRQHYMLGRALSIISRHPS